MKISFHSLFGISFYEFKQRFFWVPWILVLAIVYLGFQNNSESKLTERERLKLIQEETETRSAKGVRSIY